MYTGVSSCDSSPVAYAGDDASAPIAVGWDRFFAAGTRVIALPSWADPRLLIPASGLRRRWHGGRLLSAFRPLARARRLLLRGCGAAGLLRAREAKGGAEALRAFLRDVLPSGETVAVAIARPGPARKVTVFLAGRDERLVGFLKYGESRLARVRIEHEHRVLERLPPSVGPSALRCDAFADGVALVTTPVEGRPMKPTSRPRPDQERLLEALAGPSRAIDEHPWIAALRRRASHPVDAWLEPLAARRWPVVVQHGDFTPWNLLCDARNGGRVRAVDWELAALEGFPYLDRVHFVLQTSALVYRSSPRRASRRALRYLQRAAGLPEAQAESLVRLAAYDAYLTTGEGRGPSGPLQAWRRSVWGAS